MTELTAENLETDTTLDGRIVLEPSYLKYIRENGYRVDGINESHTVASESSDGAHLVLQVQTYEYPMNHSDLDLAAHERNLWVCDCWSARNSSNDVAEGEHPPKMDCKHIQAVSKVRRAKEDDNQETL